MNFQVGADNEITLTSTDKDNGVIKTSVRTASWDPENGGLMSMAQVSDIRCKMGTFQYFLIL